MVIGTVAHVVPCLGVHTLPVPFAAASFLWRWCPGPPTPLPSLQLWDNDGQFLLIEAAYALPRWLKPETSTNRVWLRRGSLHVVPLPSAAAPDLPAQPTVDQALAVLREGR